MINTNLRSVHSCLLICLLALMNTQSNAEGRLREKLQQWRESRQAEPTDTGSSQSKLASGDFQFSLRFQNMSRAYMVHVPKSYKSSQPTPMVISLHGGGGNMEYQANEQYYHQISQSDQAGYIVVFPNGYSRFPGGKLATWNAGLCCGQSQEKNIDDVSFIKMVIEDMKTRANIDSKRVFVDGMSNGGMMSYRLACDLADSITAIASVAGTDNNPTCAPSRPISILHIHAMDDDHVPFNGGIGEKSQVKVNMKSVPETVYKWVKLNACNPTPQRVLEMKGAYCEVYSGCKEDTQVKLCVTENGGHSWPGGQKVRDVGQKPSMAFSATEMIWNFFQASSAKSPR